MKDFVNTLYRNHSLIYKVLLFICTTFLIVYLFPKSGRFKYNFEKGKPWQSENLYAPFNFAIKKSADEIESEKQNIENNSVLYFDIDNEIEDLVKADFIEEFSKVFSDTIPRSELSKLFNAGQIVLSDLYNYGVLSEDHNFLSEKNITILDNRVEKQKTQFSNLVKQDKLIEVIDKTLASNDFDDYKTDFKSLFFDIVEPNLI